MTNALRMPFAEWLHRMTLAEVPYQARTLAIYAAVFNVTSNDELSMLCGIEGRTFDRWKKHLSDEGWVRIGGHRLGGRGLGVEVHPAVAHTPVTFTDVSPRNPRKYYPRNSDETPAIVAPLSIETPAEITPVSTETPVEIAGVIAPSRAHAESNNINTYQGDRLVKTTTVEQAERGLQGENHSGEPPRRQRPTAAQFDRFWKAYPLHKGKPKARERFLALSPAIAERAIAAAAAYAAECVAEGREARHVKWAQGWLSEKRYDDEQVDPAEALRGPEGERWGWWRGKEDALRALPLERWRAGFDRLKPNGTWPWWKLGPPPGHDECLFPEALCNELRLVEIYQGQITHV